MAVWPDADSDIWRSVALSLNVLNVMVDYVPDDIEFNCDRIVDLG